MIEALSGYYPVVLFRQDAANIIHAGLVTPKLEEFFAHREVSDYYEIHASRSIGAKDFSSTAIYYFYNQLLDHIAESESPIKAATFSITHDRSLATELCDKTGLEFSTIKIGLHPFHYYIFIDIQDVFDFLNKHNLPKPEHNLY